MITDVTDDGRAMYGRCTGDVWATDTGRAFKIVLTQNIQVQNIQVQNITVTLIL